MKRRCEWCLQPVEDNGEKWTPHELRCPDRPLWIRIVQLAMQGGQYEK